MFWLFSVKLITIKYMLTWLIRRRKCFELIKMNCLILLFRAYYYGLVTDVYIIIILDILYSKKFYTMFNEISERSAVRY